ncbi:MAG: glycosyltransferase family 4 protein [Sphingomonadaceae bacterium]
MSVPSIAIILSGLGAGGAERVIAQLARHWCNKSYDVSIISFDHVSDPVYHTMPEAVRIYRLGGKTGRGIRGNLAKVHSLRRVFRQIQPDIAISFLTKINLIAALAAWGTVPGLICSERNNPEQQQAHPLWNQLLRFAYHRADRIVCQTRAVRRCFAPSLQDRIVVIPNPIAGFEDIQIPDSGHTIAAAGRLTWQKGFDQLITAFAKISDTYPDWNLDIWGDGPDRSALQNQIMRSGLSDRVTLRGNSPCPGSWLEETNLFVLSSRYEGFGNVLAEAMLAGLPVIAMKCDFGPEEMVTSEESGLLVPPGDIDQLAAGMARMMGDEELRNRLGEKARIAATAFAPETIFRQWDRVVASVTEETRPGLPESKTANVSGKIMDQA